MNSQLSPSDRRRRHRRATLAVGLLLIRLAPALVTAALFPPAPVRKSKSKTKKTKPKN